jgi:phosphoenolpyruvate carboxylase
MAEPRDYRDPLREQIHLLGDLLGETIIEQEARPISDLVEEIRALAKAHRAGSVEARERLLVRASADISRPRPVTTCS